MFSIEVRVNGSVVSALQACNRGLVGGLTRYEYQAVQFPLDLAEPPKTWRGFVDHHRDDGIAPLVAKLTAALAK